MARIIDYFFTIQSPWTYLGHTLLHDIAAKHGATVNHRPVPLLEVFDATGSLPLAKRPVARQAYRWLELQRWRDKRNLPLNLKPSHFPLDSTLINKAILAVIESGASPAKLVGDALAGAWAEEKNFNDEKAVAALITANGFDAKAMLEAARSDTIANRYDQNGIDAIAQGIFGAPAYVLNGEFFWGQDRLELLDDALTSGRGPYKPV